MDFGGNVNDPRWSDHFIEGKSAIRNIQYRKFVSSEFQIEISQRTVPARHISSNIIIDISLMNILQKKRTCFYLLHICRLIYERMIDTVRGLW